MTQTKTCNNCHIKKSRDSFSKDKSRIDGLSYRCKECQTALYKNYYNCHRTTVLIKNKLWRKENVEKYNESKRLYRQNNSGSVRDYMQRYRQNRYLTDISYRLKTVIRSRVTTALIRGYKYSTTTQLLGCSIEQLKKHLQAQFKPGMSWENYGKWHVDHIKPCARFDLTEESEQKKCFHYTNLQPLWAEENQKKGSKY